ncbi:hypothetical protein DCO58_04125 [Helicobacter saguini]|uniref:Uncharacterized protein n=1 Tax=Helicobacter saguini TaxID=1548018 RepID=A0A347VSL3_9HELI|nr:hypothetical protein [Helicobacter saguini]MWV62456.1 hypothetical protein [Helicobacter saguini]MWV66871.1 hypothetical protein [Helicobacter saguini]MWV69220.1 hypothetical protein [Helicobacter saguini]MWV71225.1 hypothetical protein [Helicobacter saguini]TLD93303.1 hypothetical protein LS64_008665 [Helicobacter saguini]
MQYMETITIWLDSMKIALLEKDSQRAFDLTQNLPFDSMEISQDLNNKELLEYLQMAKELISQAIELLQENKKQSKEQLDKIFKAKRFFE